MEAVVNVSTTDARGFEALPRVSSAGNVNVVHHQIERRFGSPLASPRGLRDNEMRPATQLKDSEIVAASDRPQTDRSEPFSSGAYVARG